MSKITLTDEQKLAIYNIYQKINKEKALQVTLGGYAGTGKTTIIKSLIKLFPEFAVAAFTGKAANVLRKKGIHASTIHSRIYEPIKSNDKKSIEWTIKNDPECRGFIIDEASMVSHDIFQDLSYYKMPMIFVGDHGQLEPINSKLNLMKSPDFTLEYIHRNAGNIAKFAEHLRKGNLSHNYFGTDDSVQLLKRRQVDDELLTSVDQIICAYNKTRVHYNQMVRKILGYSGTPQIGERVMCLRNNKEFGVFNGMQGTIKNIFKKKTKMYMDFESDGYVLPEIPFFYGSFDKETPDKDYGDKNSPIPFDYAYCITAHKSQGDEFDKVLVVEQKCANWEHHRWAYTCASRAKTKLYWINAF